MPSDTDAIETLQFTTLRVFSALHLARERWGGVFVLGWGLSGPGRALALASLGLGAAGIFLEGDVATLRAAERLGCCTFTVNSLSEALRAVKNELRQGRAITVGLSGEPSAWIAEILERGVLPDVMAAEQPVTGLSARSVHGLGFERLSEASVDLAVYLDNRWHIVADVAGTMSERLARDAAFACSGPTGPVMRDWLRVAPSLFPREKVRAVWDVIG